MTYFYHSEKDYTAQEPIPVDYEGLGKFFLPHLPVYTMNLPPIPWMGVCNGNKVLDKYWPTD